MPTIGVSIAIPSPHAEMLQAKRASFGDPLADSIPTHVTLLPPTEVDGDDLSDVVEHLAEVAAHGHAFPMVLRGTGTFRPISPVVFVTVAAGVSGCELLADAVRSGPLEVDLTFPYHPHVTIAHHLDDARVVRFIAWMEERAGVGWFVNDLHRHALPALGFGPLAAMLGMHPFVRHDGPASFRRAFKPGDWRRLLAEAGLPPGAAEVRRFAPFRLCVGRIKPA